MARETATESFSELLNELYETVLDPTHWQSFLVRVSQAVSAKSALLRIHDAAASHVSYALHHGLDPSLQQAYRDHYIDLDPWIPTLKALPAGVVYPAHRYHDMRDVAKTEYFNDYMRPQNNFHVAGGFIHRDESCSVLFAVQRERSVGPFGDRDIKLCQLLVPHMKRVATLQRTMTAQSSRLSTAESALERMSIGVVLLDRQGTLEYANRHAEAMLQAHRGIRVVRGQVTALDANESRRLRMLIGLALAENPADVPRSAGSMLLSTNGRGERNLFTVVHPVGPDSTHLPPFYPAAAVALYMGDTAKHAELSGAVLQSLYGLTRAESRLARELAGGRELKDIAERLHLSINTLRTQLRALFQKTGTQRQTELVRLLSAQHWRLGTDNQEPIDGPGRGRK